MRYVGRMMSALFVIITAINDEVFSVTCRFIEHLLDLCDLFQISVLLTVLANPLIMIVLDSILKQLF